jgi:hypothetical protein
MTKIACWTSESKREKAPSLQVDMGVAKLLPSLKINRKRYARDPKTSLSSLDCNLHDLIGKHNCLQASAAIFRASMWSLNHGSRQHRCTLLNVFEKMPAVHPSISGAFI